MTSRPVDPHAEPGTVSTNDGEADRLTAAIRTLLPGLRLANYVERWASGSPAVQALSIVSEHVGEGPVAAGETVDPDIPSAVPTRPAGLAPTPADRRAMFEAVAHEHRPTPDALAPCGLRCVCGMRTTAYEQHLVNVLLSRLATPDPAAALGGNRFPRRKETK